MTSRSRGGLFARSGLETDLFLAEQLSVKPNLTNILWSKPGRLAESCKKAAVLSREDKIGHLWARGISGALRHWSVSRWA